jgi:hypothetical protein
VKNLKRFGVVIAAVSAVALQVPQARADGAEPIEGSISFVGNATTDGTSITSATEFTSISAEVATDSGDYALVPSEFGPTHGLTSLSSTGVRNVMTDYSFNPSQNTVTPLWQFTTGGVTYTFDATTLTAVFNSSADAWDIGGAGVAIITGGGTDYAATDGTWSATVTDSHTAFNFGSEEDPPTVPDGGLTVTLLGTALAGLYGFRRKLA